MSPRLRRVSGDWRGGGGEGDGFGRRGAHDDGAEFGETLAGAGDEIGAGKAVEIGEGGKQTFDTPPISFSATVSSYAVCRFSQNRALLLK